jgi:hypothetical protein
MREDQAGDQNTTTGDWWSQNAPPPVLAGNYTATDPQADALRAIVNAGHQQFPMDPPIGYHWDPTSAMFVKDTAAPDPTTTAPDPTTTTPGSGNPAVYGTSMLPGAPANFGAAPPTYTAPTWQGGAPPSAPQIPTWTAPTIQDLFNSPGFQSRFMTGQQALERSAAARGTVLNGGTQKALARYGQDYASNEYSNLVNQSLAGAGFNAGQQQTMFGDAFQNYQARYGQFTDAAAAGKNAFDTNVTNTRNTDLDYWSRLNDLYQTGANLAGGSYKPGA